MSDASPNLSAALTSAASALPPLKEPAPFKVATAALVLALPALLGLADTAIAWSRGWRTNSRLDQTVIAAMLAWLLLVAVPLLTARGRSWYARHVAHVTLLAVSLAVAWLAAELLLKPILAAVEPFHARRPGLKFVYRPEPGMMRGVGPEARVELNAWGIRGHDPPPRDDAYRVLCLGGSTTACTYLDDTKTWPARLEADLKAAGQRAWVGNAGLPNYRSEEHLQFVETSPLVDHIDCLVVQTGINDFMACLSGPRPAPPVWTQSRVSKLAHLLAYQWSTSGTVVEDSAATVYGRRRAIRQAGKIDDSQPQLDACLTNFTREIERIIDQCQRRKLRVVFTTQPVLWRGDLDAENQALLWFGKLPDDRFLSVAQLRHGMDRYNEVLRRVCRERNVELVDLAPLDGDAAAFYDDCHFTEQGAEQVGRRVADWLIEHPADDQH